MPRLQFVARVYLRHKHVSNLKIRFLVTMFVVLVNMTACDILSLIITIARLGGKRKVKLRTGRHVSLLPLISFLKLC